MIEGEGFAFGAGEVDDDVEAFGGGDEEVVEFKRCGEEAAVGADLLEGWDVEGVVGDLAGGVGVEEAQVIEARVGGVEDAEAVLARLDLEERHDFAVDAVHVAIELLDPDGMFFGTVDDLGVVEGAVVMEETVLQHEGDLVVALRQVEDFSASSRMR